MLVLRVLVLGFAGGCLPHVEFTTFGLALRATTYSKRGSLTHPREFGVVSLLCPPPCPLLRGSVPGEVGVFMGKLEVCRDKQPSGAFGDDGCHHYIVLL